MSRPVRHPSALNPVIVGMRSGSDELPALERALELATQRHTHLVVVHVIPATSGFAIAVPTAAGAVALTREELADRCHLDCELALAGADLDWSFEIRAGDAATALADAATATGQPVSSSADTTTRRPSAGSAARRSASRKPAIVRSWSCRFATRGPRRSTSPTTTRRLGRVVQPGGARGSGPRHK